MFLPPAAKLKPNTKPTLQWHQAFEAYINDLPYYYIPVRASPGDEGVGGGGWRGGGCAYFPAKEIVFSYSECMAAFPAVVASCFGTPV
jgi:hypothetical protein